MAGVACEPRPELRAGRPALAPRLIAHPRARRVHGRARRRRARGVRGRGRGVDGGRAIDVGANHGCYTRLLARASDAVEAFEPQPFCAETIEAPRTAERRPSTAKACPTAPASSSCTSRSRTACRSRAARRSVPSKGEFETLKVPVRRLDDHAFTDVASSRSTPRATRWPSCEARSETLERERPVLLVEIMQCHLPARPWRPRSRRSRASDTSPPSSAVRASSRSRPRRTAPRSTTPRTTSSYQPRSPTRWPSSTQSRRACSPARRLIRDEARMTTPARPVDAAAALANSAAAGDLRLTPEQALTLLRDGDMLDLGPAASEMRDRLMPAATSRSSSTATSTTPTSASPAAASAPSTAAERPRRLRALPEELAAKVAETHRARRHGDPAAGRHAPRPQDRVVRGHAARPQGRYPHPRPRLRPARDRPHRAALRHLHRRGPPRLRDAGLDSLPGGGAEILVDRVRALRSPHKATSDEWLDVMREAHKLDISTTATMMFGGRRDARGARRAHARASARCRTRRSPAGTWAFARSSRGASSPATPNSPRTSSPRGVPCRASGWEYLRTLAVTRLFLDNVAQHPGELGHAGRQDRPGRARVRRQRHGLDDDRGERRRGRRHALHARARRAGAPRRATRATRRCSATRSTARCGGSE